MYFSGLRTLLKAEERRLHYVPRYVQICRNAAMYTIRRLARRYKALVRRPVDGGVVH